MILSVSRRTDIPAFFSEWFFNRLQKGFADVRNPMNPHRVSRIDLRPEVVDCIVFWTKNPEAMLRGLDRLAAYRYYFQFTLNPYDQLIEPEVPRKKEVIATFRELARRIGRDRVVWRYDPILMSDRIDLKYHIRYFEELAKRLEGHTDRCVISFFDLYRKILNNIRTLHLRAPNTEEMRLLGENLGRIARRHGIRVFSCAEEVDLSGAGIEHGACIDPRLVERVCGYEIECRKDANQRKECRCMESIDLGAYNTCGHECAYCYANFNREKVRTQLLRHNPASSLLVGELTDEDVVRQRPVRLLRRSGLFQ